MAFPYILHKEEAVELGIKFFYSGWPCKNGHHSPRYTSTHMCLECRRMHENARILKDPLAHRMRALKWSQANPEKVRARARDYIAKNPEAHRARALAWSRANPDEHRRRGREWAKANPVTIRVYANSRRALKKANGGTHTERDISEIMEMQNGKCAYCRIDISSKYHVDHIMPLKLRGRNDRSNLQVLCVPCNQAKSAKDPIVFAQSLGMLL